MIFGIGTDIIEVERISKLLEKDSSFKNKIFTELESEYCENKKNKAEGYAARFAAKEAFFKAIGTGWRGEMSFNEIEVINDSLGKPEIKMYGKVLEFFTEQKITSVHVSVSHIKSVAVAIVILEK